MTSKSFLRAAIAAAALLAVTGTSGFAQRPPDEFTINVQGWTGGAFGREDTRQFSHCGVSREFDNGVTVAFQTNTEFQTVMALRNPDWALEEDDGSVVQLSVDGEVRRQYPVVAAAPQVAVVPLGTDTGMIDALRRGRELTVTFTGWQSFQAGDTLRFPLTGTSASLRQLRTCVETANRLIAANPEAMAPSEGQAPQDRMMTIEGLASLLNAAGFENVELLDPEAVPDNALELRFVWRMNDITGALHQEPRGPEVAIDDFAQRYLDVLEETCTEGFDPDVGESEVIRGMWALKRATAICEAEDGTSFMALFFALDDYNYSVFYHLGPEDRREDITAATDRIAALVGDLARDVATGGAPPGQGEAAVPAPGDEADAPGSGATPPSAADGTEAPPTTEPEAVQ